MAFRPSAYIVEVLETEPNVILGYSHIYSNLVKIFKVPFESWSTKRIVDIAGGLGKSLHVHPMMEDQSRLGYARVCVKIHVSSSFLKQILLDQGIDELTGEPKVNCMPVEVDTLSLFSL